MANISASMVKELREKSGVGMMDCKTALSETDGDLEAAMDWLRTKGLAKAAKKADRIAAEGLVGVSVDGTNGVVVEVNSETDFVARNETFQSMVSDITKLSLTAGSDFDALNNAAYPGSDKNVGDYITAMVATIGENMSLRRVSGISVSQGAVAAYVHNQIAPDLGKIGVLVGLESTGDTAKLLEFGKQVAMHIAAVGPLSLSPEDLDPAVIEKEKAVLSEQARESGKPENIIEKMIEGRIRKFYQEVVLLSQTFVIDGESTVEQAVKAAEASVGAPVKITGFVRFSLGEGIEKKQEDFAAEVAAVTSGS